MLLKYNNSSLLWNWNKILKFLHVQNLLLTLTDNFPGRYRVGIELSYLITITHERPHQCRGCVEYWYFIFVNNVPTTPSIRIIGSLNSCYRIQSEVFLCNSLTLISVLSINSKCQINGMMLVEITVHFIQKSHNINLSRICCQVKHFVSKKLGLRESKSHDVSSKNLDNQ
jgi:hypothetical protein